MSNLGGDRDLLFITQRDAGVKKAARHTGHLMPKREGGPWGWCQSGVGGAWSGSPGGGALCNSLGADRFLWQGVQMMPGQIQRTSPRRTALFGQCQIVMDLGLYGGGISDQ